MCEFIGFTFSFSCFRRLKYFVSLLLLCLPNEKIANAQTNIGSAIEVERDVSGTIAGRTLTITKGDGVRSNEGIRTARASRVQLRFTDQSNLTLGPSSSIILDRFVYNPDGTARTAAVRFDAGSARWAGGTSQSNAYQFRTPHATIGVRGTSFDLFVDTGRTIITLREGAIITCLVSAPQNCATLTTPNQMVVVTQSSIQGPSPTGPSPTQFTENCLAAINRPANFCATDTFSASLTTADRQTTAPINCPDGRTASGECIAADRWKGRYIGANIGYSWGRLDNTITVDPFATFSLPVNLNGIIGGAQIGYNWRISPRWLAGIEADIQASGQRGSSTNNISGLVAGPAPGCTAIICSFTNTTDITAKLSWFGTIRGRAGIERDNVWFYGTGGFALGSIVVSGVNTLVVTAPGPVVTVFSQPFSYSNIKGGWVLGVGTEARLGKDKDKDRWTWKIEYLHIDLGSVGSGRFGFVYPQSTRFTDEIVRVGLNYNFQK